jgi:hypothetical protein
MAEGEIRAQPQSLAIFPDRIVRAPCVHQQRAQQIVRLDARRVGRDGEPQLPLRIVRPIEPRQSDGKVAASGRVDRIRIERSLEVLRGLCVLALRCQQDPQVGLRVGEVGLNIQRRMEGLFGFGDMARLRQRRPRIAIRSLQVSRRGLCAVARHPPRLAQLEIEIRPRRFAAVDLAAQLRDALRQIASVLNPRCRQVKGGFGTAGRGFG